MFFKSADKGQKIRKGSLVLRRQVTKKQVHCVAEYLHRLTLAVSGALLCSLLPGSASAQVKIQPDTIARGVLEQVQNYVITMIVAAEGFAAPPTSVRARFPKGIRVERGAFTCTEAIGCSFAVETDSVTGARNGFVLASPEGLARKDTVQSSITIYIEKEALARDIVVPTRMELLDGSVLSDSVVIHVRQPDVKIRWWLFVVLTCVIIGIAALARTRRRPGRSG